MMKSFGLPFMLFINSFLMMGRVLRTDARNSATSLESKIDPTSVKMYDQEMEAMFGELNMGKDYFEGDILLTQRQRDSIEATRNASNIQTRALIKDVMKLWDSGVVPYVLADDLRDDSLEFVRSAIAEWCGKTCVQFREKTDDDDDYIEFVYEMGCSSYVGRIGGRQTISIGNSDGSITCKHGNIVHEIAHALGFFHEHSRPDRDEYVSVLWDNVESGYQKNFQKESFQTVDSRNVSYDYASVMHYGEFFFTKESGLRTLQPLTMNVAIGQRVGLSEKDALQGNLLYNCGAVAAYDQATKSRVSSDKQLWDRPLRDHEIRILRKSKVQQSKHKQQQDKHLENDKKKEPTTKKYTALRKKERKSSHLKALLKSKIGPKKSTAADEISHGATNDKKVKHASSDSSSKRGVKKMQIKPALQKMYSGDPADILEGDEDEDEDDGTPYSRGVHDEPVSAPETPNQLATDRATLAQEEEDTVQQQDNDDIGEENLGKGFFEGDMMLTPKQQSVLDKMYVKDNDDTEVGTKRALIKDTMYLWPKGRVYYDFHKGVDRIGRRRTRAAMRHWQKHTCLKFKRVKNPPANFGYIKFVFEGGCASRVGRGGNKMQKLTIGSPALRCKVGNIIHELGHAVGFFHEHSRPDRNKYVRVMRKNILPGYERNFFRFGRKWIDSRDVPYDYGSIMHYNRAFFSRFPVMLDTLIPLREVDIGQRKALSRFDILQANLLYQCDGRKRLTDEEIEELKEESENEMNDQTEAYCADVYDSGSCQEVKKRGYCQKFPKSMRTTCGITCNLCGSKKQQTQQGLIARHLTERKSLVNKLKTSPFKEEEGSKRMLPVEKA